MKGIYLEGRCCGVYGEGQIVQARQDQLPSVRRDDFYTIAEVVEAGEGSCARNLLIRLEDIEGLYTRKTFKVNEECMERMNDFERLILNTR